MRMWKVAAAFAAVGVLVVTALRPAAADILINISKSSQRMSVLVDGTAKYNWLVSTGTKRYTTPSGAYQPQWLARKWRSRQWNNAPMPHSIFFYKGYAIHGTTHIKRLGKIASHGCVRLHPANAAKLYSLVAKNMLNTRVVVSNDVIDAPPNEKAPVKPKRKPSQYVAEAPADTATKLEVAAAERETPAKLTQVAMAPDAGARLDGVITVPDVAAKPEKAASARDDGGEKQTVRKKKRHLAEKAYAQARSAKPAKRKHEMVARSYRRAGFYW